MLPNVLVNRLVFYIPINLALHHCRAIVVLNKSFPASLNHEAWIVYSVLLETLLAEVLNGIVISICEEVVNVLRYGVVFKFVHQPSSVAFYLFGRSNR